jgi:hypothetical protein
MKRRKWRKLILVIILPPRDKKYANKLCITLY